MSMLGRVVCGSRTWMWRIAAPALAASSAEAAICCGLTGTAGFLAGVSAEPVTAHEIITFRCIASLALASSRQARAASDNAGAETIRLTGRFFQRKRNKPRPTHDPAGSAGNRVPQRGEPAMGRGGDPRPRGKAREAL